MRPFITAFWHRPRHRKWLLVAGALVLLYLFTGFFLVPALVKWQLLKQLPLATHRRAVVRQVKCNPLTLSLTIRDLALAETNGQPFASFEEFYGNFQLSTLFRFAWTFDEISLKQPRLEVVLHQDGHLNLANLLASPTNAPLAKAPAKSGLPRLLIFHLAVTNGHAGFADLSRRTPFRTVYEPINFDLKRFTTQPSQESPYSFEAASDGGRSLSWAGTVTAQPLGSTGSLQVVGIRLPKHAPYLEEYTRARLTGGTLDLAGQYRFAAGTNGLDLVVSNLDLTVGQLEVQDPDTAEPLLGMPSLELRHGAFNWRARQVHAGSVVLTDPTVLVRRLVDGSFNLATLLTPASATNSAPAAPKPISTSAPAGAPWGLTLEEGQLRGGAVRFEDATVPGPFQSLLKPVTVQVRHFSNATNAETAVQAKILTEAEEALTLTGSYSLNPARGTNALELVGLDLKKYQPYLARWFRGIVATGKVDVAIESSQALVDSSLQAAFTNTHLRVANLQIQSPDGSETVLNLPTLAIENVSGSLDRKAIQVGRVTSSGTAITARREADGTINLLALLSTNSGTHAKPAPGAATPGWTVGLDQLALRDWTLRLADRQTSKPGQLELDQLALMLRGAQFPSNAPVATEFSARLNGAGTLAARGTILPYTSTVDTEIEVASLGLRSFQPWIESQVKLDIDSGVLSTKGRVRFNPLDTRGPKLHFTGNLRITNFATLDQVLAKEWVRWDQLAVTGIDFEAQPNRATIEQVRFAGLRTSILIGPDKRLNLLAVLPVPATNSHAPSPRTAPAADPKNGESMPLQLGEFQLEKASFHFSDLSVQPACAFDLRQLDGTVRGLSSKPGSSAEVDLAGLVDESSPFALRGKVNPLAHDLVLDLVFTNHNLQLTPFTPYLEKYAGHPLNKGRLSLVLGYAIHDKQLKAQNKVHIDQLLLGSRNQNPDASKLPVKLAVALLKDSSGGINLDLPIEGRLDDPQFSVGPILLKVLVNLIAKAAASPFKLLGALVGGGEELSFVEFATGKAQLLDAETNKLAKLVLALEKRPALSLEIEGSFDPVVDRDSVARGLVRDHLKSARLRELSAIGQAPLAAADFQVEPAEYERLLRAYVVEICGTNLTAALQAVADRAAASTNTSAIAAPSTRGPGWFKRAASFFKSGPKRAATRQAHRSAKADELLREQNPELATLTVDQMETLLAVKTEVPPDQLRQLMQDRAKAVQAFLLSLGKITADRLFLVAPKPPDASFKGEARVHLELN